MKNNKMQKITENIEYYGLFLLPLLLLGKIWLNPDFYMGMKGLFLTLFLGYMVFTLIRKKENFKILVIFLIYFFIEICYIICKNVNFLEHFVTFVEIFLFPFSLLYFTNMENKKIKSSFFAKMFYYLLFLIIGIKLFTPQKFFLIEECLLSLSILMPLALWKLLEHHNYMTKCLGIFFLLFAIVLFHSWEMSLVFLCTVGYLMNQKNKKKNFEGKTMLLFLVSLGLFGYISFQHFHSSFLQEGIISIQNSTYEFLESPIEEQIFGNFSKRNTVDFLRIINEIGILGFLYFVFCLGVSLKHLKLTKEKLFSMLFILFFTLKGGILTNGLIGILSGTICVKIPKEKRKILLVSNMYPSKRFKHYGSFVKNSKELLEEIGFQVDIVVKKKNISFPAKFIAYVKMYLMAILKSNFVSYDYIYVHFISQSAFCVLFARWVSKDTTLIYHVHGNDVLPTNEKERKNIRRSQFVLPTADKVIVPSEYFRKGLEKKYHVPSEKLIVSPSGGVNRTLFQKLNQANCRQKLGLDESSFYIGYVSRIEEKKGWDIFLKAVKDLENEPIYEKLKILVVGTGSKQKEFIKLVEELHLKEKLIQVDFVFQEDLVSYYNAMDVLIYSTKLKESLGLTALEAMACETFLIGRRKYGPKEYLVDEINSLTFEDDEELIFQIKKFLKMNQKQKEKIKKNARKTTEKYDSLNVKQQMKEIFS